MIAILLFLFSYFVIILIANTFILKGIKKDTQNMLKAVSCPPHGWGYDTAGKMYCRVCGAVPGDLHEHKGY